jgi:signal peptidase I
VFTRPLAPDASGDEAGINIIKRVAALPGETVEVRGRKLFINGRSIEEPYARWAEGGLPEGEFGPMAVPANCIFLLGDNRDHSKDSRFWQDHFLPLDYVKGRALFIYWSKHNLNRIGTAIR